MSEPISRRDAIAELWDRGVLKWKLHDPQKEINNAIDTSPKRIIVVVSSRRIGKSYMLLIKAIEECLSKDNSIVKYICPKQNMLKKILNPMMKEILTDCPIDIRPKYKTNDRVWMFPNGSQIQMEGTDNGNHENIRGGNANLCIVDEAGFCTELDYVVKSVLLPTTTTTKGKVILISTPSKKPDHEFVEMYMKPAEFANELIIKTIHDNPMVSAEEVQDIIKEYPGGESNPEYRREYLCEVVMDEDSSVVPEFSRELEDAIVQEWKRPKFYDVYVSMDPGYRDLTAVLFAYFDFYRNKVVIEDELVLKGSTTVNTEYLAARILEKEAQLFFDIYTKEAKKPFMRVSDINPTLLNDLHTLHGLHFNPTAKDDKRAAVNQTRVMLAQGNVIINPRCVNLIRHLKGATWDKSGKKYARSPDSGHYDCVDALIYLLRNIVKSKNPFPPGYGTGGEDWFDYHRAKADSAPVQVFKKIFRIGN